MSETFKEEQKPANHEEGEVDWDDFNNFMQATLDAAEAFYFLDKDRDWVLDYEETEDGIHKLIEVEILDPEEGDELLQDFDFLDEMDGHPDG